MFDDYVSLVTIVVTANWAELEKNGYTKDDLKKAVETTSYRHRDWFLSMDGAWSFRMKYVDLAYVYDRVIPCVMLSL